MKKLDKTKPYGTVLGDTTGRVYEQDNTFFKGDGTEWVDETPVPTKAKPLTKDEKPKTAPAVDKPVAKAAKKPAVAKAKKPVAPVTPVSPVDAQVSAQLKG